MKDACKDFEALFLSSVIKQMRKTVQKSELFGSDPAEDTFQEMMDDEVRQIRREDLIDGDRGYALPPAHVSMLNLIQHPRPDPSVMLNLIQHPR